MISEDSNRGEFSKLVLEVFFDIDQTISHLDNSIEYSSELECQIEEIHRKVEKIVEICLGSKSNVIIKDILNRLKWMLSETVTKQSSVFLRELLSAKLNVAYSNNDSELMRGIFPLNESPKVFCYDHFILSEDLRKSRTSFFSIKETKLKEMTFEHKERSSYFSNLITSYPFNLEKCEVAVDNVICKKGKFLLYEPYLLWFENILEGSMKTLDILLDSESNITDYSWRYYIAIMGISTIKSEYLLSHYENEFLLSGGEINWLTEGIKVVPNKLKVLADINNIIAHQPWKLETKHIKILLDNNWSKEELIEALLILVTFHKHAAVIESLRLNFFESDFETEQLTEILSVKGKSKNKLFDCLESMNQSDVESDEDSKVDITSNINSVLKCNLEVNSMNNSNSNNSREKAYISDQIISAHNKAETGLISSNENLNSESIQMNKKGSKHDFEVVSLSSNYEAFTFNNKKKSETQENVQINMIQNNYYLGSFKEISMNLTQRSKQVIIITFFYICK